MDSIFKHQHFGKYVTYCFQFVILGQIIIGLGPLIPYYSAREGRLEVDYASLLFFRAMGYAFGAISVKFIEDKGTFHHILGTGTFFGGLLLIIFNYLLNYQLRCGVLFLASIGASYMDVFTNVSAIEAFKGGRIENWLQFLHGCFGIGGFIVPYIVFLFEYQTYGIIGALSMIIGAIIYFTPSPETIHDEITVPPFEGRASNFSSAPSKKQETYISMKCVYMICGSFLLIVGQQATFGSWISSFAVLKDFSTKQHANLYSSLYWLSITFFRFAFVLVPGSINKKIMSLLSVGATASVVCLAITLYVNSELGLISASLILGFSNSALFALLLSYPNQFGLFTRPSHNSYFMLFAAFGQGSVSVGTGYLMSFFSYNMLFYTICLMNIGAMINHLTLTKQLKFESEQLSGHQYLAMDSLQNFNKSSK